MTGSFATALKTRLDAIKADYRKNFGGQSRETRDLELLDSLITAARGIMTTLERRVGRLRGSERAAFDEAKTWVGFLKRERAMIVEAKALPPRTPETLFIGEPGGRANIYTSMLRVASADDVALLGEVIEGLEACERDTLARLPSKPEPWMAINLTSMRSSLAACRAQDAEIVRGWSTGSRGSRSKLLVELAASQYRATDAELRETAAPARRPARLRAVAATLRTIAQRTRDLGDLTGAEGDAIATALARADDLEAEHVVLVAARAAAAAEDLVSTLEKERSALERAYQAGFAKQDRRNVDGDLLCRLVIRAGSVALQASDIWNADPSAKHMELRTRTRRLHGLCDDEEKLVSEQQASRR